MPSPQKVEFVGNLTEKLKESKSVVMADFKGLSVAELTDLRSRCSNESVEIKVIKNRLGKLALADAECDALDEVLKGNTAWAFGLQDAVSPAKILSNFAKENEKLQIKGGLLDGKSIDGATIKALASMPTKPELLTKMAQCFKLPQTSTARAMQAAITRVGIAFNALADKKDEAA